MAHDGDTEDGIAVVDGDAVDWETTERGDRFAADRKRLGDGAGMLGCSLYEIPPGKSAWPHHYHTANEELFYVLAGTVTVRGPEGEREASEGDLVVAPPGPEGAHQLRNDGDAPARYLAVSTMREPDVLAYPDSDKVGIFAGSPPGGDEDARTIHRYVRDDEVDYWDGEVE